MSTDENGMGIVTSAIKSVPVVKYALGLSAIAILVSIAKAALPGVGLAGMFPIIVGVLGLMVLLIVVAAISETGAIVAGPARLITWAVSLVMVTLMVFSVTAIAFDWPLAWAKIILPTENIRSRNVQDEVPSVTQQKNQKESELGDLTSASPNPSATIHPLDAPQPSAKKSISEDHEEKKQTNFQLSAPHMRSSEYQPAPMPTKGADPAIAAALDDQPDPNAQTTIDLTSIDLGGALSISKSTVFQTLGDERMRHAEMWLNLPRDKLRQIKTVRYDFSNPAFFSPKLPAKGTSDFRTRWIGYACSGTIKITAILIDGSQRQASDDMCPLWGDNSIP